MSHHRTTSNEAFTCLMKVPVIGSAGEPTVLYYMAGGGVQRASASAVAGSKRRPRARWHGARSRRTQGRRPSYTEMAKKYVIGCVMLSPGRLWCSRNLKDKLFRPSTRYRYRSSSVPLPCHVEKFHPSSERMLFVRACVFLGPLASLPLLGIKFGQLPPPTQNFLNLGVDNLTKCGRGKEATATGGRRIALSSN